MKNAIDIQDRVFEKIKQLLPADTSFVDELAIQLDISNDSAYRRIRGEKLLSIEELLKLGTAFHISFDSLLQNKIDNVSFNYRSINGNISFEAYFNSILGNMKLVESFEQKELIYMAKDLPLIQYFEYNQITAFKLFFWYKTILGDSKFEIDYYDPSFIPNSIFETGRQIRGAYVKIPSIEIWNKESINSTLNQIEFYYDNGYFKDKNLLEGIFEDLKQLVLQVKKDAALGYKTSLIHPSTEDKNNYKLYYNEVTIGDNTIFFDLGERKITNITHNVLNILTTSNPEFCNETYKVLLNIIKKSNLISVVSEKQRNKFFNVILHKIEDLRVKLID
jgi:hypothetical protein